jgi:hypothetical protein
MDKNLIILERLGGNEPTSLNALQNFLEPRVDLLQVFWAVVWLLVLAWVIAHFLLFPLIGKFKNRRHRLDMEK